MKRVFKGLLALLWVILVGSQKGVDLTTVVKEMGGTFCKFLAFKSQIHYKTVCPEPTCSWDSWSDAKASEKSKTKQRVVLSFGHNGFGNQLWQHTVAFMVAEQLKARLYIGVIPQALCFDGYTPPNTVAGISAMERLLPHAFQYQDLPVNSSVKSLCESESFFISDRPRDWRDKNYSSNFKNNMLNLINDPNPRCIRMIGYFQNLPMCADDARALWTSRMFANFTVLPGANDISIYLRCQPRHYYFNSRHYYETILNNTVYDKLWLFQAPECPTKLDENPSKDGQVASVVRLLTEKYGAIRWPSAPKGADDTTHLLHDLAGLAQSKKLIIPVSSWAFWSGLFSNATEIHVNAPPHHPLMADMTHYIYHSEKGKKYFGRFNNVSRDIYYNIEEGTVAINKGPPGKDPLKHKGAAAAAAAGVGTGAGTGTASAVGAGAGAGATTGAIRPIVPPSKAVSQATTVSDVVAATAIPPAVTSVDASNTSANAWDFRLPPYSAFNMSVSDMLDKVLGRDTIAKMQNLLKSATATTTATGGSGGEGSP